MILGRVLDLETVRSWSDTVRELIGRETTASARRSFFGAAYPERPAESVRERKLDDTLGNRRHDDTEQAEGET